MFKPAANSTGVRGIRLAEGDSVISMAILRQVDATPDERGGLSEAGRRRAPRAGCRRRKAAPADAEDEEVAEAVDLSPERFAELGAAEQFVLTVSDEGFGKRTSSYDYRLTGRGGQGLIAMISTSAAAGWWRRSRSRRATRSCWSPTRAS